MFYDVSVFYLEEISSDFSETIRNPDVDPISVVTNENFRISIYEVAAAAGKPVYAEKSLSATWDDARWWREEYKGSSFADCA